MTKPFQPTPHPVLGLPTPAQAVALGETRWRELMIKREEIIRNEKTDPFRHTWEPPIWRVCDALLGFPWVDPVWADKMRRHLGFERRISILLINGGQRGGKSQYAGNRTMRILRLQNAARGWALHSTLPMSRDYQQPIFYTYLPPELKAQDIKSRTTYIAWKKKTGFSEEKFVLPNLSDLLFKTYDQDVSSIEGGNLTIIWPDELVPMEWVETMELRIAEQTGWMIITFTPVQGYTETVQLFQDGAEVVKESVAFLSPKDGGPPDPARAMGLTEEQYQETIAADREGRASLAPQSVPENCDAWLEGKSGQLLVPNGREFEMVPRVLKCADPEGKRAVVFFHSSDNPYGNPKNVWATISGKTQQFVKERFYGIAHKTLSARFTKFNLAVHRVEPAQIPLEGTNYHFVDPCSGRNLFMAWFRVTPEHVYVYREWPSAQYIPGIGVPGPWALPDGRHPDGRRGPAQKSFGWGLLRYKQEIARIEAWKDAAKPRPADQEENEWIQTWDEHNGSRESVDERYLDSRFASTPRMEKDRPVTLLTEFEEIGLFFTPTPGDDIDDGCNLITDALDYDDARPIDHFNKPRLLISADCPNMIYAVRTWTGMTKEGRRCLDGATKDPIDLLRYFFLSDCAYRGGRIEEEAEEDEESEFVAPTRKYY